MLLLGTPCFPSFHPLFAHATKAGIPLAYMLQRVFISMLITFYIMLFVIALLVLHANALVTIPDHKYHTSFLTNLQNQPHGCTNFIP
jgi:hypothetical protein